MIDMLYQDVMRHLSPEKDLTGIEHVVSET